MAERIPSRSSTSSRSRTSQGASLRWSNPDIFSDEFALQSLTISDGSRPSDFDQNTHVSAAEETRYPRPTDLPVDAQSHHGHANAPASTRRSFDSRTSGNNERRTSHLSRSDGIRQFPSQSGRASLLSDEATASAVHRSSSQVSDFVISRTQSPYQGASDPSHPYGMYPQDITVLRSPSMATTSTVRPRERSYTGPIGPAQPYGMYLQNTVPEDEAGPADSLRSPVPVGFPGRPHDYRRRLGPDAEDADDLVGPDGYTEQLPPYTRYPDGIPPKGGRPGPASVLSAERNQGGTSEETLADPFQSRELSPQHNEQTNDSTESTAAAQSETPHKDEGGNFKELVKRKGKKRICFGTIPLRVAAILVALLLVAISAGVIGAVVGRARERKQAASAPSQNQHHPSAAAESTVVVTLTSLVDATPLASTPTNLPTLPTGTFYVPLRDPTIHNRSCLSSYINAWDCSNSVDLKLDISDPKSISVSPRYPSTANQIHFGPQPPQTSHAAPLTLMGDKDGMEKGPAWFFQQPYTKIVVIPDQDWGFKSWYRERWFDWPRRPTGSRRLNTREYHSPEGIAPIAAKPWFCYWNNTILEGFIYVTQNSSGHTQSTSSEAIPVASVEQRSTKDPSQLPAYPRDVKIEERRDPSTVLQPYCVHMQIMNDGSAQPLPEEDIISLTEYKPDSDEVRPQQTPDKDKRGDLRQRNSATSACECEWHLRDPDNESLLFLLTSDLLIGSIVLCISLNTEFLLATEMPCFKGLAVSIHTPEGPLPEYSIQRQSRFSRISAYIPVPPAKIPRDSLTNRPEQSTFAISITLLTPGLKVPYSQPAPTPEDPYPRARIVGGLPSATNERGRYSSVISPYLPLTTSPNETVAAYIYFDGRTKEEVATLLRRGEETWVNSRWVGVPESEGGGLAEREFLFREVGLERWLNGLDLQGKDAPARIERRRQKMEKRRRRRKIKTEGSDDEASRSLWGGTSRGDKGVLRYGTDQRLPLERLSDDDDMFLSGSETDDEPIPEAAGQIKIALFRVLASGEIKRGEYSPQFDAHDDDDESTKGENGANSNEESEEAIDHTTSFAKPKTLDPKSISTQTVTGIDGPDKPFAVFTFLYRGKKQLERMSILPSPKGQITTPELVQKRKSLQDPFAGLKPLKPGGARGYADYRDPGARSTSTGNAKSKATKTDSDMDSDEDEDIGGRTPVRTEDGDSKDLSSLMLSPEDAKDQEEVAEGVKRIRLKRQHSAEPLGSGATATRKSPESNSPTAGSTPPHAAGLATTPPTLLPSTAFDFGSSRGFDSGTVGSPLKRARASVSGQDEATRKHLGLGLAGIVAGEVTAAAEESKAIKKEVDEDEEL
ncbi:MAG: hypothetical protein Q9216_005416 [Gyalolechia sp. 2 TL-2023]